MRRPCDGDKHVPTVKKVPIGRGYVAFEGVCSCEAWMGPLRRAQEDAEADAAAHADEANNAN